MGGGSNGGGLLGSIMALNMMNNMQSQMGSGMMQSNYNQPHFNSRDTSTPQGQTGQMGMAGGDSNRMIFCAGCSKKHSVSERFALIVVKSIVHVHLVVQTIWKMLNDASVAAHLWFRIPHSLQAVIFVRHVERKWHWEQPFVLRVVLLFSNKLKMFVHVVELP